MLDQFAKLPVGKKLLILGVFIVVIAFLFWQFHYSPLQNQLEREKRKEGELAGQLKEAAERKRTYDEDLQKREDLKIAAVKQRQILPVETEMASFLNNLNTVADLAGLEILSVKPLEASPEKYYARIPVQLKLKGSYLQLAKFFYQVGRLDRIINIENINLSSPKISEGGAVMQADVLATTFRALETGQK